jgi:hypothetical protein
MISMEDGNPEGIRFARANFRVVRQQSQQIPLADVPKAAVSTNLGGQVLTYLIL